ncbi:hypothetical protein [Desulfosporosinus sp. BICA1-9]|uniref:hypothetical protein n=1 Tax=Desulfosporosinus sp. BICA1-9 TaxID=1531958 RepID=UPI0025BE373D|nr:hypothetical protein [Desulfosporosinus sp. BICA1-9]
MSKFSFDGQPNLRLLTNKQIETDDLDIDPLPPLLFVHKAPYHCPKKLVRLLLPMPNTGYR